MGYTKFSSSTALPSLGQLVKHMQLNEIMGCCVVCFSVLLRRGDRMRWMLVHEEVSSGTISVISTDVWCH